MPNVMESQNPLKCTANLDHVKYTKSLQIRHKNGLFLRIETFLILGENMCPCPMVSAPVCCEKYGIWQNVTVLVRDHIPMEDVMMNVTICAH